MTPTENLPPSTCPSNTGQAQPQRCTGYTITMVPDTSGRRFLAPPEQRLKLLVKAILRAYGFRITNISEVKEGK